MSAADSAMVVVDDGVFGLALLHRVFIGYYRHAPVCHSGRWRVLMCVEGVENFDAVMDDFGNLVRVAS